MTSMATCCWFATVMAAASGCRRAAALGEARSRLTLRSANCLRKTACPLTGAAEFGKIDEPLHGAINRVHLITGMTCGVPKPDGREVIAAAFFSPYVLPKEMTSNFAGALPGWITAARAVLRQ